MKVVFTNIHGFVPRGEKEISTKNPKKSHGCCGRVPLAIWGGTWYGRWCVNEESTFITLNVDYLSMKQGSLFCFVTLRSLEAHDPSCHTLGIFGKLSMSMGAPTWLETVWSYMWKLFIIQSFSE